MNQEDAKTRQWSRTLTWKMYWFCLNFVPRDPACNRGAGKFQVSCVDRKNLPKESVKKEHRGEMPVHSHQQSANFQGIEGCSANMSRLHSTWYMAESGDPHNGSAHASTWQARAASKAQRTETLAQQTALDWAARFVAKQPPSRRSAR